MAIYNLWWNPHSLLRISEAQEGAVRLPYVESDAAEGQKHREKNNQQMLSSKAMARRALMWRPDSSHEVNVALDKESTRRSTLLKSAVALRFKNFTHTYDLH